MARQRTDTRARIRAVALELFVEKGFEKASLREIAERLGITKAALYYHFPSKTDLLRELVQPMIDDVTALVEAAERAGGADAHRFLADYFDAVARNRTVFMALINDISVLGRLGLVPELLRWRDRMQDVLVGSDASPMDAARVTVAVGGLQDAALLLTGDHVAEVRAAAVAAAHRALTP